MYPDVGVHILSWSYLMRQPNTVGLLPLACRQEPNKSPSVSHLPWLLRDATTETIAALATRAFHPALRKVGARLRELRGAKGWSRERLALAVNMDRSYVSGLERGEFNVSLIGLAKLARALSSQLAGSRNA